MFSQVLVNDVIVQVGTGPAGCVVEFRRMSEKRPKVGGKIKVNMHAGRIVDATIKAVIDSSDGVKYQVDFGFDQTALVHEWQIVKD
jgi:hypothetical protein